MSIDISIQDTWTFRDLFRNQIQAHKDAIQALQTNMRTVPDAILDTKINDLRGLLALADG